MYFKGNALLQNVNSAVKKGSLEAPGEFIILLILNVLGCFMGIQCFDLIRIK